MLHLLACDRIGSSLHPNTWVLLSFSHLGCKIESCRTMKASFWCRKSSPSSRTCRWEGSRCCPHDRAKVPLSCYLGSINPFGGEFVGKFAYRIWWVSSGRPSSIWCIVFREPARSLLQGGSSYRQWRTYTRSYQIVFSCPFSWVHRCECIECPASSPLKHSPLQPSGNSWSWCRLNRSARREWSHLYCQGYSWSQSWSLSIRAYRLGYTSPHWWRRLLQCQPCRSWSNTHTSYYCHV